jgi:hypothetical protein
VEAEREAEPPQPEVTAEPLPETPPEPAPDAPQQMSLF